VRIADINPTPICFLSDKVSKIRFRKRADRQTERGEGGEGRVRPASELTVFRMAYRVWCESFPFICLRIEIKRRGRGEGDFTAPVGCRGCRR
jgi:hypothetical protein